MPQSLDVFWSLTRGVGRVTVPILAYLIEGGPDPILVDTGMRDRQRAMGLHGLGLQKITDVLSAHAGEIVPRPTDSQSA